MVKASVDHAKGATTWTKGGAPDSPGCRYASAASGGLDEPDRCLGHLGLGLEVGEGDGGEDHRLGPELDGRRADMAPASVVPAHHLAVLDVDPRP